MRDVYRACANRVGTHDALALAHDLEHWHDPMEAHRESLTRLGFPPDGHPEWEGCPHAESRQLWDEALRVLGSLAGEVKYLQARLFETHC